MLLRRQKNDEGNEPMNPEIAEQKVKSDATLDKVDRVLSKRADRVADAVTQAADAVRDRRARR
jgi:hypothetical protein